jgi:type I restriction-modification system DNA methylase subunit
MRALKSIPVPGQRWNNRESLDVSGFVKAAAKVASGLVKSQLKQIADDERLREQFRDFWSDAANNQKQFEKFSADDISEFYEVDENKAKKELDGYTADGVAAIRRRWKDGRDKYADYRARSRTSEPHYEQWLRAHVGQWAIHAIQSLMIVRTLEDRGLMDCALAGPGAPEVERMLRTFYDDDESGFIAELLCCLHATPHGWNLMYAGHNTAESLRIPKDCVPAVMSLFRSPTTESPTFTFGQHDTDFIGDVFQMLGASVVKLNAFCQTPRFVADFIIDHTLAPAIDEFGLDEATVLDPTCGTGHFLLNAFDRLLNRRIREQPWLSARVATLRTLELVHGIELDPFLAEMARFRLLLACLESSGDTLDHGDFWMRRIQTRVVVGDSLLECEFPAWPEESDRSAPRKLIAVARRTEAAE